MIISKFVLKQFAQAHGYKLDTEDQVKEVVARYVNFESIYN